MTGTQILLFPVSIGAQPMVLWHQGGSGQLAQPTGHGPSKIDASPISPHTTFLKACYSSLVSPLQSSLPESYVTFTGLFVLWGVGGGGAVGGESRNQLPSFYPPPGQAPHSELTVPRHCSACPACVLCITCYPCQWTKQLFRLKVIPGEIFLVKSSFFVWEYL